MMPEKQNETGDIVKALQAEFSVKADEIIERQELANAASALFNMYREYIKAGFTRREAMELIKTMIVPNRREV